MAILCFDVHNIKKTHTNALDAVVGIYSLPNPNPEQFMIFPSNDNFFFIFKCYGLRIASS